jgi:hypothetical protein
MTFHELLSDLNPLQYVPVVGTIYRAITGDVAPEPLREGGSLVISALVGGPLGVATNLVMLGLEKLTGIDPEQIGQRMLASIGVGKHHDGAPADAPAPGGQDATPTIAAVDSVPAAPWTAAQLAAYGVGKGASGTPIHAALGGADLLNAMELSRLSGAAA